MVTPVTYSPYSLFCQLQRRSPGSALLGQHWDPPTAGQGAQQGLGSQDRAGSGQISLEPVPNSPSPDHTALIWLETTRPQVREPWAPLGLHWHGTLR